MRKLFLALCLMAGFASPAMAGAPSAALIEQGRYLAVAGDCFACHAQSGKGGHAINSPLGAIYATNITPSKTAGIGNYTLSQFSDAVRRGVRADGSQLYPAMPYTAYAKLGDEDLAALYAYFMHGVQPVDTPSPQTRLPFPFNLRFSMKAWNALFLDDKPYAPVKGQSVEWNRGAYLVQGLGHCSACHSSRTTLGGSDDGLSGGLIPVLGWYAPSLTSDAEAGLGDWDTAHIVELLQTGVSPRATVFGPMAEVVRQSLQHMETSDVRAMAVYLKSLPGPAQVAKKAPRDTSEQARQQLALGAKLYEAQCASCHQADGKGVPPGYPPLAGNRALTTDSAVNAIRLVLNGGFAPGTTGNPRPYGMPPFGPIMDDAEVAAVVTYLRASWGNDAPAVSALEVNRYRSVPLE